MTAAFHTFDLGRHWSEALFNCSKCSLMLAVADFRLLSQIHHLSCRYHYK